MTGGTALRIDKHLNGNCQFDNEKCLCQFCKAGCSKWLTCLECISEQKTVHDISQCTGFKKEMNG